MYISAAVRQIVYIPSEQNIRHGPAVRSPTWGNIHTHIYIYIYIYTYMYMYTHTYIYIHT